MTRQTSAPATPQIPEQTGMKRLSYTMAEAAEMTGIPLKTLYAMTESGALPCKRIGRRKFIRTDDLNHLINSP